MDVHAASGCSQICVGLEGRIEASVHAVYLYNKDTEGILQCSNCKCVQQHKQKSNPPQHEFRWSCPIDNPS